MQRGPTSGNKSSNKSRQQIVNINLGDHVVRTVNTKTTTTAKTTSKKRVSAPSKKKVSESTRPVKRRKAKTDGKPSVSAKQKALADEMKSLSNQWHDAINAADPNFVTSEMSTIPNDLLSPDSISDMERLNEWLRQDIIKLNALPRKGAKSTAFNIPVNPAFANQFGQQLSLENIRAAEERADKLAKTQQEETTKVLNLRKDLEGKENEIKKYAFYLGKRNERLMKAKEDLKSLESQSKWSDMYGKLFKEEMSAQKRKERVDMVVKAIRDAKKDVIQAGSNAEDKEKLINLVQDVEMELDKEKKLIKSIPPEQTPSNITMSAIEESSEEAANKIRQTILSFETPTERQPTVSKDDKAPGTNIKQSDQTSEAFYKELINYIIDDIGGSATWTILKKPFQSINADNEDTLKSWGKTKVTAYKNLFTKVVFLKKKVRDELKRTKTTVDPDNFANFIDELDNKAGDRKVDGMMPGVFFMNLYDFYTSQETPTDPDELVLIVTQASNRSVNDGRLAVISSTTLPTSNTVTFHPFILDTGEIDRKKKIPIQTPKLNTPFRQTPMSNFFGNTAFLPTIIPKISYLKSLNRSTGTPPEDEQASGDGIFEEKDPKPELGEGSTVPPIEQPEEGSADLGPDLSGQSGTEVSVDPAVLQLNEQAIAAIERKYPPENTNEFMDKTIARLLNYLRAKKTTKTIMNSIGLSNVAAAVAYFAAAQKYLFSEEDFISSEKLDSLANMPQSIRLVKFGTGGPFDLDTYYLYVLGKAVMRRETLGGNNLPQRAIFTKDGIPYEMAGTNQINP